jgi:hypothetical protein
VQSYFASKREHNDIDKKKSTSAGGKNSDCIIMLVNTIGVAAKIFKASVKLSQQNNKTAIQSSKDVLQTLLCILRSIGKRLSNFVILSFPKLCLFFFNNTKNWGVLKITLQSKRVSHDFDSCFGFTRYFKKKKKNVCEECWFQK